MIYFLFFCPERMLLGLEQLKEVEVEAWDRMLQLLLDMYILFKLLSQTRSSQMATEMVRRDILKTKWKCVACCS